MGNGTVFVNVVWVMTSAKATKNKFNEKVHYEKTNSIKVEMN